MAAIPATIPATKFPLFKHPNGQWAKKIKQKPYYFGVVKDDPKGEAALLNYLQRKAGIDAGLDTARVAAEAKSITLGQLRDRVLDSKRLQVASGELSLATLNDYINELGAFVTFHGVDGDVQSLRPTHFSAYAKELINARHLGRHARRRVIAYVKAMFAFGASNGLHRELQFGTDFVAPDTSPDAMRQSKAREGKKDYSKRIVTGQEVARLLAASQPNMRAMILLGINCGLGPADIGRLKWRHIDLEHRRLVMPRGKTGTERVGFIWKVTAAALERVRETKHAHKEFLRHGEDALVFVTRKGLPVYREHQVKNSITISNAISITFGRKAKALHLFGVTFYRLRHSFKTLGKKAGDVDALNLMMGHKERSTGEIYNHEEIEFSRIKRVAIKVYRGLWPKPKLTEGLQDRPALRMATAA